MRENAEGESKLRSKQGRTAFPAANTTAKKRREINAIVAGKRQSLTIPATRNKSPYPARPRDVNR
jgi:hypothetical protein